MAYPTFTIDPYALVPLTSVKEQLNIPELVLTSDNVLIRMINASTQMIETYLDRKVMQRTYTEYYDGRANDRILLRQWPIVKPTELWDDPSSVFTDVTNKIATADYATEGNSEPVGVVLLGGLKFGKGTRNIKVIYQGGYASGSVPAILQEACILHVEFMYNVRSDKSLTVLSKGKNQETTSFLGDLPPFVKNMLAPYQRFETPLAYVGVQNG